MNMPGKEYTFVSGDVARGEISRSGSRANPLAEMWNQ